MPDVLAVFRVDGRPRTKGSLKPITPRGQRTRLVEDHPHSKPWRMKIVRTLRERLPHLADPKHLPHAGPVEVVVTFWFAQEGPTGKALAYPTVNAGAYANGDLDKLERNLNDALEDAGVIENDCQVVRHVSGKRWATGGVAPGVDVVVYAL